MDEGTLAHALLHSAADAVIAADRTGAITFWNPGATRIFGYEAGEAVGQSLGPPPQFRERGEHHAVDGEFLRGTAVVRAERRFQGRERHLVETHRPHEGVGFHRVDERLSAGDNPRLRAADHAIVALRALAMRARPSSNPRQARPA